MGQPITRAKHKRHRRPTDALDPTPPLFSDLPRLNHNVPVEAFGRNKSRPSGLAVYCKECRNADAQKDRAKPKSDKRLIKATIRKLDHLLAVINDLYMHLI